MIFWQTLCKKHRRIKIRAFFLFRKTHQLQISSLVLSITHLFEDYYELDQNN